MDQQVKEISKNKKRLYITIPLVFFGLSMIGVFQNCAKKNSGGGDSGVSSQSAKEEDKLFKILTESVGVANDLIVKTNIISQQPNQVSLSGEWDGSKISDELLNQEKLVYDMITAKGVATNSVDVLKEVDVLLNLLSQARDIRGYQWHAIDLLALKKQVEGMIKAQSDEDKAFAKTLNDKTNSELQTFKGQYQDWKSKVDDTLRTIAIEKEKVKAELESLDKIRAKICSMDLDVLSENNKNSVDGFPIIDPRWRGAGLPLDLQEGAGHPLPGYNGCVGPSTVSCKAFTTPEAITQCNNVLAILENHQQQLNSLRKVAISHDAMIGGISLTVYGEKDKNNGLVHVMDGVQSRLVNVEDQLAGKAPSEILKQLNGVKATVTEVDNRTKDANGNAFNFREWASDIKSTKDTLNTVAGQLSQVSNLVSEYNVKHPTVISALEGSGPGNMTEVVPYHKNLANFLSQKNMLEYFQIISANGDRNGHIISVFSLSVEAVKAGATFVLHNNNNPELNKDIGPAIRLEHHRDNIKLAGLAGVNNAQDPGVAPNYFLSSGHGGSGFSIAVVIPKTNLSPLGISVAPRVCNFPVGKTFGLDIYSPVHVVRAAVTCQYKDQYGNLTTKKSGLWADSDNQVVSHDKLPANAAIGTSLKTNMFGVHGGIYSCEEASGDWEAQGASLRWVFHPCAEVQDIPQYDNY